MKTAIQYFLCLSCLGLLLSACDINNEEELAKSVPIESELEEIDFLKFSDFGCENAEWYANPELSDTFRIVNSIEELDRYIRINCIPQIDYSRYSLIIGNQFYPHGMEFIDEKVEESNSRIVYTLTYRKYESLIFEVSNINYHFVVKTPPQQKKLEVVFDIK
ncbi:hypothetical protein [Marinifilum caeruleilacunae]|uniref:Lipoprotein n=1 Tax=Marinifilum caeruleilacunae TaxID=2499076 RepID=A0ABX1WYY0_9BACT|nr:hypothetical protein [Marinifilum caeruleilacunae]NOU61070.1 hypothetical protein [Marinifilum caeruleilacunae]